jgi:hypothetical protein
MIDKEHPAVEHLDVYLKYMKKKILIGKVFE